MDPQSWTLVGVAVAFIAAAFGVWYLWRPLQHSRQVSADQRARREFRLQREHLEARFFDRAACSGKPRGLRWTGCDFDNDVTYARDRRSGQLCAFVAVTISFEAIEGGLMEDVEAVGNLRAATGVFTASPNGWHTEGRAIFNLSPREAVVHFQDQLEPIEFETA